MTIFYDEFDAQLNDDNENRKSFRELVDRPDEQRKVSLGLTNYHEHTGLKLSCDRLSCDIQSLTPNMLRKSIAGLRPTLGADYQLFVYNNLLEGDSTFHDILQRLNLLSKVLGIKSLEINCC